MRRRFGLLYLAPVVAMLAWTVFPLARGSDTLYLRDVLNTHLPMKHAQAEAMRAGYLPLLDPYRALGQPLAGNPNAVPFYPDNLLYLLAPTLWALNAHFWLHLLLAAPATYGLGRAWGLGRRGAWAAGVTYALSGYFLSHLTFYNLIAGAALAPAFAAAALRLGEGRRRGRWAAAAGGLWALLLLAGDPLTAALALVLAVSGAAVAGRRAGAGLRTLALPGALGLAAGSLVAAPQIVEFVRILPDSFRGAYGYSFVASTVASWDPRQIAGWLLPFPFGRPDLLGVGSFWGERFYTDTPPYFFSLYPGLLTLALVAAAGRPRRGLAAWSWAVAGGGLFFALGRFNPAAAWLFALPGLRYPVKFWLPVAVGGALVAGLGFERAWVAGEAAARRRCALALGLLAALLAAGAAVLALLPDPVRAALRAWVPADRPDAFVEGERLRWIGLCLLSLLVVAALALAAWLARRRPWGGGAALLALHAAAQLFFLRPLVATDAALPYTVPPPLLEHVPADGVAAHGAFTRLFGSSTLHAGRYPDPRGLWLYRRAYAELYPPAAALWGRRFAFSDSPEGLDSFAGRLARAALEQGSDVERVRLLAASGVDRLLLDRELEPEAAALVRLVHAQPSFGHRLRVYAIPGAAGEARLLGRVLPSPDPDDSFRQLTAPEFEPRRAVVIAGGTRRADGPPGEVELVAAGPERLAAEVRSAQGGVLLLRRAFHRLYRARVDGHEAQPLMANLYLLAVEVPPGVRQVEVWVDRRPLAWAAAGALLGALGLCGLALAFRPRRRPG